MIMAYDVQCKGPVTHAKRKDCVWIANKTRFGEVVRDVQSAHESRTDRVRTALISLETR